MTRRRLQTSSMHDMLAGPLGWLIATGWFDGFKMAMLPREFREARARAIAFAHPDAEDFLGALNIDEDARKRLCEPSVRALSELSARRRDLDSVQDQWEDVVWGGASADDGARVELEERRRDLSEKAVKPPGLFRFLSTESSFAPTGFAIPCPFEAFSQLNGWLNDPVAAYAAPEKIDDIERSAEFPGPAGPEYLIRFQSPSSFMKGGVVTARVYEPAQSTSATPTFVYGSGLGMVYDLIRYWPEEDYMARRLAARGVRAVLPESPWHGRRETAGQYSGEPYLARAPVSIFELFSAQTQEAARIIAWARAQGSAVVGVGGISMSGLVTQQIAGHCHTWPRGMRPDMAFIGAGSAHIDQVVVMGELSGLLGMSDAVQAAGWTGETLARMRPLLDPPAKPGLDPDAILAFLGERDTSTPYAFAVRLLDEWSVPAQNRIIRDAGHIALYAHIICNKTPADRIAAMLHRIA